MQQTHQSQLNFHNLGIDPRILQILEHHHYTIPTPIQHQAIPVALNGNDVVGIAQTGTGKTLAFGIPLVQKILQQHGQGLVLVPTRELALQVEETLVKIGRSLGIKTAVIIGGASAHAQVQALKRFPQIIIATPGRLVDHLKQKNFSLSRIKIVVLDEADRMFDIGFAPQIKQILKLIPKGQQTMLFSATMPPSIVEVAAQFMKTPLRIEVAPQGTTATKVEQEIFVVSKEIKMRFLDRILTDTPGTILVFSRTKHGAKKITHAIQDMGHSAAEIHSNRSLAQRRKALEGFKSGVYRVLVATDIAARGIDVKDIALVINYDLPDNPEDYVHRIGRTGRAGGVGKAISFVTPEERHDIKSIEKLIRKTLPILALPSNLPAQRPRVASHQENKHSTGFQGAHRGRYRGRGNRSSERKFSNNHSGKFFGESPK
jgi:ATP-dependent RNA helicase RhlE